jgi:glyoxylase-like metal-dependent hydrolase (beta-lactamase superfamily II)
MRLAEDDKLTIEGVGLDVLYTPGHTDDSYSFLMQGSVFTYFADPRYRPYRFPERRPERARAHFIGDFGCSLIGYRRQASRIKR